MKGPRLFRVSSTFSQLVYADRAESAEERVRWMRPFGQSLVVHHAEEVRAAADLSSFEMDDRPLAAGDIASDTPLPPTAARWAKGLP